MPSYEKISKGKYKLTVELGYVGKKKKAQEENRFS